MYVCRISIFKYVAAKVQFSEVVIGGAGGAAAPPIIETVRVLKGCQHPQKSWP